MNTYTCNSRSGGITGVFRSAETWLDEKGKVAWIAALVASIIVFWPVGLVLLAYMIWANKFSCPSNRVAHHQLARRARGSSGNSAFDAYRDETLRRLEEEQQNFEAFLDRLRAARDKAEFDQFMEERAHKANSDKDRDDEEREAVRNT